MRSRLVRFGLLLVGVVAAPSEADPGALLGGPVGGAGSVHERFEKITQDPRSAWMTPGFGAEVALGVVSMTGPVGGACEENGAGRLTGGALRLAIDAGASDGLGGALSPVNPFDPGADLRGADFEYEGEMAPDAALNPQVMKLYPFNRLSGPANVLVLPGLQSANISAKLLRELAGATTIGPMLIGMQKPVQIAPMTALAAGVALLRPREWLKNVFVLAPLTPLSVYLFASVMGLLWLSTVPPTSGLVAVMFGTKWLTMLFGFAFFSHQVGGFLGVWLGGIVFEALMGINFWTGALVVVVITGIYTIYGIVFFSHQMGSFLGVWLGGKVFDLTKSYDLMWWICIGLGILAAMVHWPIVEKPVERTALAPV